MSRDYFFNKESCNSQSTLIWNRETFGPLGQVIHKHYDVPITITCLWHLKDIYAHTVYRLQLWLTALFAFSFGCTPRHPYNVDVHLPEYQTTNNVASVSHTLNFCQIA